MKAKILSTLAVVGALTVAMVNTANATGGWTLAADSAEGNTRYFVSTNEFNYTVNKHGAHVFGLPVRAASNGETTDLYAVVDASGCIDNGGDLIIATANKNSSYWWSPDGNRMYDGLGKKICEIAAAKAANNTLSPQGKVKPAANYY